MARNLQCNFHANLLDSLKKLLFSEDFVARNKMNQNDFTRNRKLPFQTIVCFFLNFTKGSSQDELDKFFQAIKGYAIEVRKVSKAAFSKARLKLNYQVFLELNQFAINFFYENFKPILWNGFRLLGIDGTTCVLPNKEKIIRLFGGLQPAKGDFVPMARVSQVFDVLNKLTIESDISGINAGEREQAKHLLANLKPNDLILLDRGYPSFWLFKYILNQSGNFCARISSGWTCVKDFLSSAETEKIVLLQCPPSSIADCFELDIDREPFLVRLIKIQLKTGETEILITSLLDSKKYPCEIFEELYHFRWPIEEDYKTVKCKIEVENFSGESVLSVYQDFYSKMFSKNLVSLLSLPVQIELNKTGILEKYSHQVNNSQAISKCKHSIILILLEDDRKKKMELLEQLLLIISQSTEPIRPGRKFSRNHKKNKRRFYPNYKRCA